MIFSFLMNDIYQRKEIKSSIFLSTNFISVAGEAMEKGLRECCRSIRIGKVLIKVDEESNKPKVSV